MTYSLVSLHLEKIKIWRVGHLSHYADHLSLHSAKQSFLVMVLTLSDISPLKIANLCFGVIPRASKKVFKAINVKFSGID